VQVVHWIMIGTAAAGIIFPVCFWWFRRRVSRLDALEAAVFGADGVQRHFAKYVTEVEFRREIGAVQLAMRGISEEGVRREDRLLKAIENQTLVIGSEVRELKTDVRDARQESRDQVGHLREDVGRVTEDIRQQSTRIDAMMRPENGR
jgi:hypothetical protein